MAGLFDYQDPESVGRMMFAAGLLNASGPSRMPVSAGQAIAQGLIGRQEGASQAAQNARRNLLLEAQARHLDAQSMAQLMAAQQGGKKPAALQVAEAFGAMTQEQQRNFMIANHGRMFQEGGVWYLSTPDGSIPLNPQGTAASNAGAIAGAKANATEDVKARYDVMPTFDPATNRDIFTTRDRVLGLPPRPQLSAFNQPSPIASAPRVGQPPPMSRPNPDAVGLDAENGYRSTAELGAAIRGAGQQALSTLPAPANVQPPAAGNATRRADEAAADKILNDITTSSNQARQSVQSIQTIGRVREAMDGGVIAGPGQTFREVLSRVGQMFGAGGKNEEEILQNTTTLMQGLASLSVKGAALLQGQGQVSNFERQMVEKAAAGDMNMTVPQLRALMDALEKVSRLNIQQHQDKIKAVPPELGRFVPYFNVELPPESPARPAPATGAPPPPKTLGRPRILDPLRYSP